MNQLNNLGPESLSTTDFLFRPIKFGDHAAANRVFLAPLTRCRAVGHLPNELMKTYYKQRSSAGLLITECTMVSKDTSAFAHDPGIYSEEQVKAWKPITEAVHDSGAVFFMQIWHAGRAAHPKLNGGKPSVAPSAVKIKGSAHTPEGELEYTTPKSMTLAEIQKCVADFKQAAQHAKDAGFDGVEVHAANGYLIDQFLRDGSNKRTDQYGGSLENRCRFLFEVLEAVTNVFGSGSVGVRLSPVNGFNDMKDSDPLELSTFLALELNRFNLAYTHVIRGNRTGEDTVDIVSAFANYYEGALILNMDYDAQSGGAEIEQGRADAVAYGQKFIANPDLPKRFKHGWPLNPADESTFYTQGKEGYTDYPFYDQD